MRGKLVIIVIVILFVTSYSEALFIDKLEQQLKEQKKEIERLEWFERQTKNYMLINLKQSEIINRYQSSRNDAHNDSELQELILNLE